MQPFYPTLTGSKQILFKKVKISGKLLVNADW